MVRAPAIADRAIRGSVRKNPLTDQLLTNRPFRPISLGGGAPFSEWIRKCILYARASVVRKNGPPGVIFYDLPRILGVRPYLNFAAPDAKNTDHYQSACRMGLLAYAAFPNAYWGSASELRSVDGGSAWSYSHLLYREAIRGVVRILPRIGASARHLFGRSGNLRRGGREM